MTRGAWMCRQFDDSSKIWCAPRENEKPFTDSERAQKWRLSLASLLFFTVLLSDHLWFCAEANLTRTRDKEQGSLIVSPPPPPSSSSPSMADRLPSAVEGHQLSPTLQSSQESPGKKAIFLGNSTKTLLETCPPHRTFGQCYVVDDAQSVCRNLSEGSWSKPTHFNLSHFYLPFCNSYTLSDLFSGFSNPDTLNCSEEMVENGDVAGCRRCVQTYRGYDQNAQEKYQEFEVLLQKYLQSDEYSVKSCSEDCKISQRKAEDMKKGILSTSPGYVPSFLKLHNLNAVAKSHASNTVWRYKHSVHLYYQITMMSSMVGYQVSSVQGCMNTIQPMQNQNAVMSDGIYREITNPKGLKNNNRTQRCVTGHHSQLHQHPDCVTANLNCVFLY
ncbi:NALCN channel auxiliary factor 1 isoform X2 [Hyla sarda]|uniref:NALCN channel auxiliary factor 1 isoform X2 n=1 Tax=Hyla sarda TaxID=327740 RepID=UPI0024C360D6|nr:NALCN channel auxiliary factor 1 isoform X2 [Hyla sarda]